MTMRLLLAVFDEKWKVLQDGVTKLVEFLDTDLKKPFDYNEYSILYS